MARRMDPQTQGVLQVRVSQPPLPFRLAKMIDILRGWQLLGACGGFAFPA